MFAVNHKKYGEGYAICFREKEGKTYIVIDFGDTKREFSFPEEFANDLCAKDQQTQKDIISEITE